jgi:hypothetical protein
MFSLQTPGVIILILCIVAQISFFLKTYKKIKQLVSILPASEKLRIIKPLIPVTDFQLPTSVILGKIQGYLQTENTDNLHRSYLQQADKLPGDIPGATIFYMPHSEGNNFPESHVTANSLDAIYRFIELPGENRAAYSLNLDTYNIQNVVTTIDQVMSHACENITGLIKSDLISTVQNIEHGIVSREGDNWIIIKKAKIALFSPEGVLSLTNIEAGKKRITLINNTVSHGNKRNIQITDTINSYLLRSNAVQIDYAIIKDTVERNCDAAEEEITQTVSTPLYVGLLGTFSGIIAGIGPLISNSFSLEADAFSSNISALMAGVVAAMAASFLGLLLTLFNNVHNLKKAKLTLSQTKHGFYSFVQTELHPLLNNSISSTLEVLQLNLNNFNTEFKTTITELSKVMAKNSDSLELQRTIIQEMKRLNIEAIIQNNLNIITDLKKSLPQLQKFNEYLDKINILVTNTKGFIEKVDTMLTRTDELGLIGSTLNTTFQENRELQKFLQLHYNSLDESKLLLSTTANGVADTIKTTLEKLKEFAHLKMEEVKQITLRETEQMRKDYPERWKNLEKLQLLEHLNTAILQMTTQQKNNNIQLTQLMNNIIVELQMNNAKKKNNRFPVRFISIFRKKTSQPS